MFRRSRMGTLHQLRGRDGCTRPRRRFGCARARSVEGVEDLSFSPDGRTVYAANGSTIASFVRAPLTGALRQPAGPVGCIGRSDRPSNCARARGVVETFAVAPSPDGANVYAASFGVAAFSREGTVGGLRQLPSRDGCVGDFRDGCAAGRMANSIVFLRVSDDGRNIYAVSSQDNAIVVFSRGAGA